MADQKELKTLSRKNGEINSLTKDDLQKELAKLKLDTCGHKDVLKKRLKNYWKKKLLVLSQSSIPKNQFYDYLLVIDFEATCEKNCGLGYKHEIIEFPVVLVDTAQRKIIDEFRSFVKPSINPQLTEFCTELTGIRQENVSTADSFPEVLSKVEQWMQSHALGTEHKFAVATDGPWDMSRFMYLQCRHSHISFPKWCRKWVNVRKAFGNFYKLRAGKLQSNLEILQLPHTGRLHSGIDDSRNIAAIVIRMLEDGCVFRPNERIFAVKLNRVNNNDDQIKDADVVGIAAESADSNASDCEDSFDISSDGDKLTTTNVTQNKNSCSEQFPVRSCNANYIETISVSLEHLSVNDSRTNKIKCSEAESVEVKNDVDDESVDDLLMYWSLQGNKLK